MATSLAVLLVPILQLMLLLHMCGANSVNNPPGGDDVVPTGIVGREWPPPQGISGPPPQEVPESVILPDGSCCYTIRGFTFCLNPKSATSWSFCVPLCGNRLCVSHSIGDERYMPQSLPSPTPASYEDAKAGPPKGLTRQSDIVDIRSAFPGGCCTCVKGFVEVCLEPADEFSSCSSDICGYKLCFKWGLCFPKD